MLVVLMVGAATFGLAGCGGGGSSKAKSTSKAKSSPTTAAHRAGAAESLAAYLKCLGQHGVDVKKVAAAKKSGGAGAALQKDPHFKAAVPSCRHLLS
jgi:ABC-type glycerol-3-phosphate transport system substrate-binding protein